MEPAPHLVVQRDAPPVEVVFLDEPPECRVVHWIDREFVDCVMTDCRHCMSLHRAVQRYTVAVSVDGNRHLLQVPFPAYYDIDHWRKRMADEFFEFAFAVSRQATANWSGMTTFLIVPLTKKGGS